MNDGLNDCRLQFWTRLTPSATFGLQHCFIDSQNQTNKQVSTIALESSSSFRRQHLNSHTASIFNDQFFWLKTCTTCNYPDHFIIKFTQSIHFKRIQKFTSSSVKVAIGFSSEHRCRTATPSLNTMTNSWISIEESPRSLKTWVNKWISYRTLEIAKRN